MLGMFNLINKFSTRRREHKPLTLICPKLIRGEEEEEGELLGPLKLREDFEGEKESNFSIIEPSWVERFFCTLVTLEISNCRQEVVASGEMILGWELGSGTCLRDKTELGSRAEKEASGEVSIIEGEV
ncbi:hypothetical protein RhiirB3_459044 [Rhizophagus irregularis]|nr:hypothetical protein RhiirB3_459044 [Rhizophagus irregularis]